jgi:excisionase family DNA binding protein
VFTVLVPSGEKTEADEAIARVLDDLHQMLDAGQDVRIMVVAAGEFLSPREAGEVLGFSRQHVRRLIDAGELDGTQLPGSEHWRVSAASLESFLARRTRAAGQADTHARELDALGAPFE